MAQKWLEALPAKTGRSMDDWLELIRLEGPSTEKEQREWLKAQHNLGTNSASWLAERTAGKGAEMDSPAKYLQTAEQYIGEMFSGAKAGLRPLYDELLHFCLGFAPEVKACPCKTIVPLYRHHVIAQLKPATRTRLDFGFALGNTEATGKLIDTGGFTKKDRITHRIEIKESSDLNAEVKRWFQIAYERDA